MKRKHEPARLDELQAFVDQLQPVIVIRANSMQHKMPMFGIQFMASSYQVLESSEYWHDWNDIVAKMKRSIARYWSRIYSIRLLIDFAANNHAYGVALLAGSTVNGVVGRTERFAHGSLRSSGKTMMTELLVSETLFLPADLVAAVRHNDTALVRRIVDSGVDINSRISSSALSIAAVGGHLPMLHYLLGHPDTDVNDLDDNGNSFIRRTGCGLSPTVLSVIAPRVDLHVQNNKGQNIIHHIMEIYGRWTLDHLSPILRAGSDTITLCVDNDGNIPSVPVSDPYCDVVATVRATQYRGLRSVSAIAAQSISVQSLVQLVMSYYTDADAVLRLPLVEP